MVSGQSTFLFIVLKILYYFNLKFYEMETAFNTLYKPVFFQEIPSLKSIVSCRIVQESWHNELLIQKLQGKLAEFLIDCVFLRVSIDLRCHKLKLHWNVPWEETQMSRYISEETVSLSVQSKIQRNMELYALNLIRDFSDWMIFHGFEVFHDICYSSSLVVEFLYYFDEFDYDVYGRIDYKNTAKNLLFSAKLTLYQKFIIACIYCFEEKVEKLWPLVQTEIRLDNSEVYYNPLLQYWITRMTTQLDGVFLQYNSSIMFSRNSETYSAMQYFWKDITTFDEKVNCIGLCFEHDNSYAILQCINYWFPKMNDEFLKCVISRFGTTIMIQLIHTFICRKFMLSFWEHTGDMFNGDQFINILKRINAIKFRDFRLVCRVLWCNAPKKLKTYALNHYQIEDSFNPLNDLTNKIYVENKFNINNVGSFHLRSDWIYYPDGCECNNYPGKEDCNCYTLLR